MYVQLLGRIGFWLVITFTACKRHQVIFPERKDIIETVYASGKIISENEYKLASLGNGTIIKKLIKDGDTVTKGQLLYVIANEAAKGKFNAAKKNYNYASNNLSPHSPLLNDLKLSLQNATVKCSNDSLIYHRYKILWEQHIGTRNNLDYVNANYQLSLNQKKIAEQKYYAAIHELEVSQSNARSQLTTADEELQNYFIRSDRNGVVYQTYKESGEIVFSNEVVALMGEPGKQLIRLAVDQQDINKVRTGQQVLLQTDATGDTIYEAIVTYIYPVMNEQDQTFRVDARFAAPGKASFIHTSIEANIVVQKKCNALVLPRSALAGKDSVWIKGNRNAKKAAVETGITTLDDVEIISGLDEATPVLVNPQNDKP